MNAISGIDVAKHELVIYINDEYYTVPNTVKSLRVWFKKHKSLIATVKLFTYEPTGGYERILAKFLDANNLPRCQVHANHVRAYAKALGCLAKTDKIDAKMIADFAEMKGVVAVKSLPPHEDLQALINRREQLLEMVKQDNNRLETLDNQVIRKDINKHLSYLKKRLKSLEDSIKDYVEKNKPLKEIIQKIISIPGVGFITAVTIIVYLPELFESEMKGLIALSGLAPMNKDSGQKQFKRRIQGGRSQIRRVLYMAALSATKWNPVIKEFYERLISKGKVFKVAITAAMRKLLTIIKSVATRETPWVNDLKEGVKEISAALAA